MASNETEQLSIFAVEKPEIMGLAVQELKVKQGGIAAVFSGTCNVGSATELNPEAWAKGMFRHGFALAGGISQAISWFYEVEQELVEEARRRSAGAVVQSADELTDDSLRSKLGGGEIRPLVPIADVGESAFTDGVNAPNGVDGVAVDLPKLCDSEADMPDYEATVAAQELQDLLTTEHGVDIKVRAVAGATGADWLQVDFPGEVLDDLPEFKGFRVVKSRCVDSSTLSPEAQQAIDGAVSSFNAAFGVNNTVKQDIRDGLDSGEPTPWSPEEIKQEGRKTRKTKPTVVNLHGDDQNGAAA